jgi:DNA-binding transcriptional LysR family regulator
MLPEVDLETLRLLVAVVDAGSLTSAAAQRGISQPAASSRVREFEARWRLAVIRRSTRGSFLTSDGEAVVAWARQVLYAADTMRSAMEALSTQRRSGFVIAASLTVAEHLVPHWLGVLHVERPDVRPVLRVVNSEAVAEEVRNRHADIGFIESARLPAGLSRKTIGQDRLAIVVAKHHPWARRRSPLTAEELNTAGWVLREEGSGTRSTFQTALGHEPRLVMEATSTTALVGAALAGVGPAVVSVLSIRAELETGQLISVPVELDLSRPLNAIWRPGERLSEPARDLLAIAVDAAHT